MLWEIKLRLLFVSIMLLTPFLLTFAVNILFADAGLEMCLDPFGPQTLHCQRVKVVLLPHHHLPTRRSF